MQLPHCKETHSSSIAVGSATSFKAPLSKVPRPEFSSSVRLFRRATPEGATILRTNARAGHGSLIEAALAIALYTAG